MVSTIRKRQIKSIIKEKLKKTGKKEHEGHIYLIYETDKNNWFVVDKLRKECYLVSNNNNQWNVDKINWQVLTRFHRRQLF